MNAMDHERDPGNEPKGATENPPDTASGDRARHRIPVIELTDELLVAYVDGELSAEMHASVQARVAQDLVLRGDQEGVPPWAALWGAAKATVSSHTAKTFRTLGDHANAEKHYAVSARRRPEGTQRITALTLAAQGREQALQGHVEQACDTWGRSLDMLGGVRSARAAEEVAGVRRYLRMFERRGVRAARELDERARMWQLEYA